MSKKTSAALLKYGLSALGGALAVFLYLRSRAFAWSLPPAERYRMLCDAFSVPGLLLAAVAALIWLSNAGSFTGVGFLTSFAVRAFIPALGHRGESYGDYLRRRDEKPRVKGYGFLLQVGLCFLLPAIIFLVLFYLHFEG